MFRLGDQVCYPMHGVGIVDSIEDKTVLGVTASYYVLRFTSGRMTAMVPVKTAEKVGLRYVITPQECDKVLAYFNEAPEPEDENWNRRYRDNCEKLRKGDVYEVADVVKCLSKREEQKGLSAGERKMLVNARQVLLAEMAAASGKDPDELFLAISK